MMRIAWSKAMPLSNPLAVARHFALRHLRHACALEGFVGEFLRLVASKTVQTQRPIDEVVAIRAGREGVKLSAVTDLAKELDWLLRGEAEDADCALRRFDQTGQQVH